MLNKIHHTSRRFLSRARLARDNAASKLVPPVYRIDNPESVYLTFDDGPDPVFTLPIATLLAERGHSATFFFVGSRSRLHPKIVQQTSYLGHTIGSHSAHHLQQWTTSFGTQMEDYHQGHDLVEEVLGRPTQLFRPPYGHYDFRSALFSKKRKLKTFLWSIESYDWQERATPRSIFDAVIPGVVAGDIVLMHDSIYGNPKAADRSDTIAALESILPVLESAGMRSLAL